MTKVESLRDNLAQALSRLEEALQLPATDLAYRDACIQRFEFTFELSWKLMQAILQDQRIEAYGVKNILRHAVRMELITDYNTWNQFLQARNLTTHTYKSETAQKVYDQIKSFPPIVHQLLDSC